ncbi:MAG: DUF3179 domain-containing protein [Pirellulaceae bacterium]|nr:DUF3179 domain-containing protein [Pirellulaceae bacterium]
MNYIARSATLVILWLGASSWIHTSHCWGQLEYQPRTVLPFPIRAITDPPIVAADKVQLDDNDLVLGVQLDGKARAYPLNQLTGPMREIINDELAATPIAATW